MENTTLISGVTLFPLCGDGPTPHFNSRPIDGFGSAETVRVFRLKLKALLQDITHSHIFGTVVAMVHVIEFQKRGLPHTHILLMLEDCYKPRTHQDYDLFVSAEIPNPQTQPLLYEAVMRHMIHGPCGNSNPKAPCMKDSVCSKGFQKR